MNQHDISKYDNLNLDELKAEYVMLREFRNQRINLAVSILSSDPTDHGAKKQHHEIQQEAVRKYEKPLTHLKKLLIEKGVNPDSL